MILDVQLEFFSSQISSEIKEFDVIFASEGHVALSADLQAGLEQLNSKPDNVLFKTKFVSQQVLDSGGQLFLARGPHWKEIWSMQATISTIRLRLSNNINSYIIQANY